jgi:hypothetical protein
MVDRSGECGAELSVLYTQLLSLVSHINELERGDV